MVSKSGAAKSFAKQLGWQEALTKLFILRPISTETSEPDLIDLDITMEDQTVFDTSGAKGDNCDITSPKGDQSSQTASAISPNDCVQDEAKSSELIQKQNCDKNSDQNSDTKKCDSDNTSVQKPSPPTALNLNSSSDSNNKDNIDFLSQSFDTPSTPLYLKSQFFDDLGTSASEEEFRTISRSSSASAEDLSTIAQRAAEQKSLQKDISLTSLSQLTQSESGLDLSSEAVELRRDSISSHENSSHRMYSSLGLRGSFLMDVVENSEELCQNLLIVLFTVMWKGVEGSDKTAWKVRYYKERNRVHAVCLEQKPFQ